MIVPADRVRMATAPSTVMLFSSERPPLMLKPPLLKAAKPRLLKLPPMTPAFSAGTPSGLRPENESCSRSLASTVLRTVTSVWSGGACEVTVTVSVNAPVSSVNARVTLAAASSWTAVRVVFLNPSSSTEMSYLPGISDAML